MNAKVQKLFEDVVFGDPINLHSNLAKALEAAYAIGAEDREREIRIVLDEQLDILEAKVIMITQKAIKKLKDEHLAEVEKLLQFIKESAEKWKANSAKD